MNRQLAAAAVAMALWIALWLSAMPVVVRWLS